MHCASSKTALPLAKLRPLPMLSRVGSKSAVVHSFTNLRTTALAGLAFFGGAGLYALKTSFNAAISSGDIVNLASSWACAIKLLKLEPLLNLIPASSNHLTTCSGCCVERPAFHHARYGRRSSGVQPVLTLRRC